MTSVTSDPTSQHIDLSSSEMGETEQVILPDPTRAGAGGIAASHAYLSLRAKLFPGEPRTQLVVADRYTLTGVLGKGAMGVVFAAFEAQLNRVVALKVMGPRSVGLGKEKLLREAQNLALLNDSHVVQIHAAGEYRGEVYLAMEYVKGNPLDEWLRKTKPGFPAILDVLISAGRGISAAHEKRIVHRDIKPANILVGDDGRTRVADFGLAWVETDPITQDPSGPTQLSTASSSSQRGAGTPAYMAPEQFRKEQIDPRSDIFSFCIVAWEAIYGTHPFPAVASQGYAQTICEGRLRPPKNRPRQVPLQLERILRKGLLLSREDRYSNMVELLVRLDNLRQRQTGRRLLVVLGLVITIIIATYAYIQRGEAHEQSARAMVYAEVAQGRLKMAQELVRDLLEGVLPMYQSVPGTGDIQKEVAARIEMLGTVLNWDADDTAKIRAIRIEHLTKLGQIHETHGQLTEAIVRYEEALKLAKRLDESIYRDEQSTPLIVGVLMLLGNAQRHIGNFEAARGNLMEANLIGKERCSSAPNVSTSVCFLAAMTYNHLGHLDIDEGNRSAARINYRKYHDMAEELVDMNPRDVDAQEVLLDASLDLGMFEFADGMLASARALFDKALERARFLVNGEPSNARTQKLLAYTLKNLGDIESEIGSVDRARTFLEEALDIYSMLESMSPDSAVSKHGIADISESLGKLALENDDLLEARSHFHRRLRYYEELVKTDPRHAGVQSALADSMNALGGLEMQEGDYAAARGFITQALGIQEMVVTMNPRAHRGKLFIVETLLRLGDLEMTVDNDAVARIHFERGFRLAETVASLDAQNNQARKALLRIHGRLGDLAQRRGSTEVARVHFTRASELAVFLAEVDDEDINAQYDMVEAQLRLAELAAARKDKLELPRLVDSVERLLTSLDRRGQASEVARRKSLRARLRETSQKLGQPPARAKTKTKSHPSQFR